MLSSMKQLMWGCCIICVIFSSKAYCASYFEHEVFNNGVYYDADKTYSGDSQMCWAAGTADMLMFSGWNAGYSGADAILNEYKDHFRNTGNYTWAALNYWFYGSDLLNTVDVSGGGGYYNNYDLSQYYNKSVFTAGVSMLDNLDTWLHNGYGTSIAFDTASNQGHLMGCYGIETNDYDEIIGLYVVDNNDFADKLIHLSVYNTYDSKYNSNVWRVQGGYYNNWTINTIEGLVPFDKIAVVDPLPPDVNVPVPEPMTITLLGCGLFGTLLQRRRNRNYQIC